MINYFQAIHKAVFYKKIMFEMFKRNLNMFIDLWRSCDQNKNDYQDKNEDCIYGVRSLLEWLVLALNPPKKLSKFFFLYAKTSNSIKKMTPYYNSQFCPCLILCFSVETLGYLKTCLNWASTFRFIYLNLFSKGQGGVRPRATIIWCNWILWGQLTKGFTV